MFNLGFIEPIDTSQNTYLETHNETSKLTSHTTEYDSVFYLGTEFTTTYSTYHETSILNTLYGETSINTGHNTDVPTEWTTAYTNTKHQTDKPTSHTSYYNTVYSANTFKETSQLTEKPTNYTVIVGYYATPYNVNTYKPTSHNTARGTIFYNTEYDFQTKHSTRNTFYLNTNHNTNIYAINTYIGTSWPFYNGLYPPDAGSNTYHETSKSTLVLWFDDYVTESNYTQLNGTWRSYSYISSNWKDSRIGTSNEEFTLYSSSTGGTYYAPEQAHTNYEQTLVAGRFYQREVVADTITYNSEKIKWVRGTFYTDRYNSQAINNTNNVYAEFVNAGTTLNPAYKFYIYDGTTTGSQSSFASLTTDTFFGTPGSYDNAVLENSSEFDYFHVILDNGEWYSELGNGYLDENTTGSRLVAKDVNKIRYLAFKRNSGIGSGLENKYQLTSIYSGNQWRITRYFNTSGNFYIYQSDGTTLIDTIVLKSYTSSYFTDSTSTFVWYKGTFTGGIPALTSTTSNSNLSGTWWRHTLEWYGTDNYRKYTNNYSYTLSDSYRTEYNTGTVSYNTYYTCYWRWGYTTILVTSFNTEYPTEYHSADYDTFYDTAYSHQTYYVSESPTNYNTLKPTEYILMNPIYENRSHNTDKPTLYNTYWDSEEQTSHLINYNTKKDTLYTSYMNTQFDTEVETRYDSFYNTYKDTLFDTNYPTQEVINQMIEYSVNTSHVTEYYSTYYDTFFNTEYRFG